MPADTADAIVIGAGHNGLVAANLLADAGWDVLVLEARASAGGAVRSAELAAPGFHTDRCSAFFPLAAASPVLRGLGLTEYGLRWRHAPEVLAHLLPNGRAAVLRRDPARTAASLETFAAGDGRRGPCGWPGERCCRRGPSPRNSSPVRVPGCCWPAAPCTPISPWRTPAAVSSAGCWRCWASGTGSRSPAVGRSGSPTRWWPGCA